MPFPVKRLSAGVLGFQRVSAPAAKVLLTLPSTCLVVDSARSILRTLLLKTHLFLRPDPGQDEAENAALYILSLLSERVSNLS